MNSGEVTTALQCAQYTEISVLKRLQYMLLAFPMLLAEIVHTIFLCFADRASLIILVINQLNAQILVL